MEESKKITNLMGETVDFTPLKYDPSLPKITQADLDAKIKEKQARQEQLRQESSNRKMQQLEAQSDQLFMSWLEATDDKTRQQYASAGRISDMAWVIRDYAMNNGIDLSNANDNDVVSAFMQSNPNKADAINGYIAWSWDLYSAAAGVWFIKPQQQEEPSWGSFLQNVVGWAYDSVTWLGRLIAKYWSEWIWEIAKFLWADEEKVNNLVQSYQDSLKNFSWEALGANTDSYTYKGSKLAWDLLQVAAWEWLARWAIKGSQALNAVSKAAESWPLWAKAAKAWLEWAADMWLYTAVSEWELPCWTDLAEWAVLWAAFPMAWAWLKAWKKVLWEVAGTTAEKQIMRMNKLSKWVKADFEKRFWVNEWKFLNDRWIVWWNEETVNWLTTYMKGTKDEVDKWLAAIQWTFWKDNKILHEVADDVAAHAAEVSTRPEEVVKWRNLAEKAKTEWLTMSEINDVKRYYERNNKFTYYTDNNSKKLQRATNLDNDLRERQLDMADKNWFGNLRELNKETAASKYLLDAIWKEMRWSYWNDYFWLSDWVLSSWTPEWFAMLLAKKWLSSDKVRTYSVKLFNRINWHENISQKVADIEKIMSANSEKELEKLIENDYNTLKLPQKEVTVQDLPEYTIWSADWNNARIRQWTVLDRN